MVSPISDRDSFDDADCSIVADPTQPRVHRARFRSAALSRWAETIVVTPPGWRFEEEPDLPVVWLLHGGDDVASSWLTKTDLLELTADDRVHIVLPDGGAVGYYTKWFEPASDGVLPDWEAHHLAEIPRVVLSAFTTSTRWAIAGLSMGGYGAMAYAARHPHHFAAAASLSGLPHLTKPGVPLFLGWVLARLGEPRHALWGSVKAHRERWLAHDPYHLVRRLAGTPIYLTNGDGEPAEGDIVFPGSGALERLVGGSTRTFSQRLIELGIDHVHTVCPGVHNWSTWQRSLAQTWPWLVGELALPA